jgi:hypothetical protein
MDVSLLAMLFGPDGRWSGPCTVILDADANVEATGSDAIVQGGIKSYAPRLITGRIVADNVRLMPDCSALVLIHRQLIKKSTGDDLVKHTLLVVDVSHVAAIEFDNLEVLAALGVQPPK